jgi:hypothetical protein
MCDVHEPIMKFMRDREPNEELLVDRRQPRPARHAKAALAADGLRSLRHGAPAGPLWVPILNDAGRTPGGDPSEHPVLTRIDPPARLAAV